MEPEGKFVLPSPCFKEIGKPINRAEISEPCLAVPQNNLPMGPPMYGPRGSTIPPRFLGQHQRKYNQGANQQHSRGFKNFNNHGGKNFHNPSQQRQFAPVQNYNQDFTKKFWCETCDRPFNTAAQLESHKYEHQICGIDDCMFIGHPSVVAKHIEAQHTTGLYQKIKNLSTPEEIAKWREERIKRYPTRANVELRQKARAERMNRGEKLYEKKSRFGQRSDRRQINKTRDENIVKSADKMEHRSRNQQINKNESSDATSNVGKNRRRRKRIAKEKKDTDSDKILENKNKDGIFNGNLKMFEGTLLMLDYHPKTVKNLETNALSSLLAMYGSSSESESNDGENLLNKKSNDFSQTLLIPEEDEGICGKSDGNVLNKNTTINNIEENNINDKVLNQKEITENIFPNNTTRQNASEIKEIIDIDDIPDEEPIVRKPEVLSTNSPNPIVRKSEDELTNPLSPNQEPSTADGPPPTKRNRSNGHEKSANSRKKYNTLLDYSKLRTRRQNTMLEKLLETDIRHERNVLLQCVRHVVKNNFFGIGQKKT